MTSINLQVCRLPFAMLYLVQGALQAFGALRVDQDEIPTGVVHAQVVNEQAEVEHTVKVAETSFNVKTNQFTM